MSKSLNKMMIIGNLGADPEVRMTSGGTKVANLRIATNEKWSDKQGNPQEHTEWMRVTFFGPVAEIAEKYCSKGDRVYVEGSLRTEKWTDRDGNDRYTTGVRGQSLILLGGGSGQGGGDYRGSGGYDGGGDSGLDDDQIPF